MHTGTESGHRHTHKDAQGLGDRHKQQTHTQGHTHRHGTETERTHGTETQIDAHRDWDTDMGVCLTHRHCLGWAQTSGWHSVPRTAPSAGLQGN